MIYNLQGQVNVKPATNNNDVLKTLEYLKKKLAELDAKINEGSCSHRTYKNAKPVHGLTYPKKFRWGYLTVTKGCPYVDIHNENLNVCMRVTGMHYVVPYANSIGIIDTSKDRIVTYQKNNKGQVAYFINGVPWLYVVKKERGLYEVRDVELKEKHCVRRSGLHGLIECLMYDVGGVYFHEWIPKNCEVLEW